jgi:hypothetical protein
VLTGILSHHLSWVTPYISKQESDDTFHPLSRLISSIYGSNYFYHTDRSKCAKKFCRIILLGKNKEMMKYLSFILSYFLKSEQLIENNYFIHNGVNQLTWLPTQENSNSPSSHSVTSNAPMSPVFQSKSFFNDNLYEKPSKVKEIEESMKSDPDSPTEDTEDTEDR